MDNLLEERCRVTWRAWCDSVRKTYAEKDAFVESLQEKFNILENDFRYNLNLLKIRESELVRSRSEALQVHDLCQEKSQQVEVLEAQVQHLETTMNQLQASNAKNKNNRQKLVLLLRNLQSEIGTLHNTLASQKKLLQDKDEHIAKVSHALDVANKENLILDDKLIKFERQVQMIGEKFINADSAMAHNLCQMESKLLDMENENRRLKTDLEHVEQVKGQADERITSLQDLVDNLERENEAKKHLDVVKGDLDARVVELINENVEIKEKFQNLRAELAIVNEHRNELINVVAGLKLEHQQSMQLDTKYEQIVKQNEVLKDVIRSLRRENDQNVVHEEIVEDLEEKVAVLKDAFEQMVSEKCSPSSE